MFEFYGRRFHDTSEQTLYESKRHTPSSCYASLPLSCVQVCTGMVDMVAMDHARIPHGPILAAQRSNASWQASKAGGSKV